MDCIAITNDRKGKRYNKFLENNKHLEIKAFDAILGRNLSNDYILKENLATKEFLFHKNFFSYGAIGCAASHKAIWQRSITEKKNFLVLEDDCYTHPKIEEFIENNNKILNSCDVCFFGLTTNSVMQIKSQEGLEFTSIYFNPAYPKEDWIKNAFHKTDINKIMINKFIKGFGYWAYFLTPSGAKKLIELILPLSLEKTVIPLIDRGKPRNMPHISIDRAGCAIYREIDALMTFPFLAYNQNLEISTTEYTRET